MGAEKMSNWCLQDLTEEEFVEYLLKDQPFVPKYFPYEVALNKKGAENFAESISKVEKIQADQFDPASLDASVPIIDSRNEKDFKKGHLKNAINLMGDISFETWLGSLIAPGEKFYLVAENEIILDQLIGRIAKIGYESQIKLAIAGGIGDLVTPNFDSAELKNNEKAFTIVDIRNPSETRDRIIFDNSIKIPLYELRERANEIPVDKPIIVHCEMGFRSAAGSSIIKSEVDDKTAVYDMGAVKNLGK
jgi:rhodanese-related sulfurtransferase